MMQEAGIVAQLHLPVLTQAFLLLLAQSDPTQVVTCADRSSLQGFYRGQHLTWSAAVFSIAINL